MMRNSAVSSAAVDRQVRRTACNLCEAICGIEVATEGNGVIGTNRTCAWETVAHFVADFEAGRLVAPARGRADLVALVRARQSDGVALAGRRSIDLAERRAGANGTLRRRITTMAGLVKAANGTGPRKEMFDGHN